MRNLGVVVLCLASAVAAGHDLYLVSGVRGAQGAICARIGENFPESEGTVTADRVELFRVRGSDGIKPLVGAVEAEACRLSGATLQLSRCQPFRIYTDDLNRANIEAILNRRFEGFTLYPVRGCWRGACAASLVIELAGARAEEVRAAAEEIRVANRQEAVLVVEPELPPGSARQFCAPYAGAGPAIAEMVVQPRFIRLKAEDFNHYLQGEGLKRVLAARQTGRSAQREGRELYSRYAKLLLGAGGESFTRAVGHVLEIVPEKDPAHLPPGEPLPVRVLFQGQPLRDAQVAAVYAGAPLRNHQFPVVTRTDGQGRALLPLDRAGLWYARLIYMAPAQGDPDVDWRSFFATLTFEVPQR